MLKTNKQSRYPTTFFTPIRLPQVGHICWISLHALIKNGRIQSGGKSKRTRAINQVPQPTVGLIWDRTGFQHCWHKVRTGISLKLGAVITLDLVTIGGRLATGDRLITVAMSIDDWGEWM
jgi:hypothetical protein